MTTILHLSVRSLTLADTAAYRTIRLHGLQHHPTAFTGSYAEEVQMADAEFSARLTVAAPSAMFGAFHAAALVGIVGFRVPTAANLSHKATLWGMYTLPSVRRLGVGRTLLNHLLAHARQQQGIEQILLAVSASNTHASRWYETAGFRLYGLERHAVRFGQRYEDDELRVLDLSSDRSDRFGETQEPLTEEAGVRKQIAHHSDG